MKRILIIGKPASTKTTFLAQLYSRTISKKNSLSLYKPAENITAIIEARIRLSMAEETIPTPTESDLELLLPLQYGNTQFDLYCPDYGGEQIDNIINNREIDKKWIEGIKKSNNWVLFIRISSLNLGLDLSGITFKNEDKETVIDTSKVPSNMEEIEYSISDQTFFIELLQIMLHIKAYNYHVKNSDLKLNMVLTCWDELNTNDIPSKIFSKYLPLLYDFVKNNWQENCFNIMGLSAQGFRLNLEVNKQKYLIEGPEEFGYVIKANGEKSNDLTEIIVDSI